MVRCSSSRIKWSWTHESTALHYGQSFTHRPQCDMVATAHCQLEYVNVTTGTYKLRWLAVLSMQAPRFVSFQCPSDFASKLFGRPHHIYRTGYRAYAIPHIQHTSAVSVLQTSLCSLQKKIAKITVPPCISSRKNGKLHVVYHFACFS